MDDLMRLFDQAMRQAQSNRREMYERAERAITVCAAIQDDPARMADMETILAADWERVKDLACAYLITADNPNALASVLAFTYYYGYKAGQEAQAQDAANDGVDWSGEIR